jgi:hypothetical protein
VAADCAGALCRGAARRLESGVGALGACVRGACAVVAQLTVHGGRAARVRGGAVGSEMPGAHSHTVRGCAAARAGSPRRAAACGSVQGAPKELSGGPDARLKGAAHLRPGGPSARRRSPRPRHASSCGPPHRQQSAGCAVCGSRAPPGRAIDLRVPGRCECAPVSGVAHRDPCAPRTAVQARRPRCGPCRTAQPPAVRLRRQRPTSHFSPSFQRRMGLRAALRFATIAMFCAIFQRCVCDRNILKTWALNVPRPLDHALRLFVSSPKRGARPRPARRATPPAGPRAAVDPASLTKLCNTEGRPPFAALTPHSGGVPRSL